MRTELGLLLRIDGADADALGLEPPSVAEPVAEGNFDIAQVMAVLDTIYDPEIPISIVELGLVYRCEAIDQPDGTRRVEIDMTMTAPGCGMGDLLSADATRAVAEIPGVDDVEVALVWDPPWSMHRISEAARLQLGLLEPAPTARPTDVQSKRASVETPPAGPLERQQSQPHATQRSSWPSSIEYFLSSSWR